MFVYKVSSGSPKSEWSTVSVYIALDRFNRNIVGDCEHERLEARSASLNM